MKPFSLHWAAVPVGCCLGLLLGCGGGNTPAPQSARETAVALKLAGQQYGEYLAANNGAPPKDLESFRKFIESRLADLVNYNVKSADDVLSSRRDGQPFALICGKKVVDPDQPDLLWAAYEQTGVDGNRLAANVRGGVVELSTEEFARRIRGVP
jgi:hypothetical protein